MLKNQNLLFVVFIILTPFLFSCEDLLEEPIEYGWECVGGDCVYIEGGIWDDRSECQRYSSCSNNNNSGGNNSGGNSGSGNNGSGGNGSGGSGSNGSGSGGNGSGNQQYGDLTFWSSVDLGCGPISIEIQGLGYGNLTHYYPTGNPGCGASDCANFYNLPLGTYYYTVHSSYCSKDYGSVTISALCTTIQFTSDGLIVNDPSENSSRSSGNSLPLN